MKSAINKIYDQIDELKTIKDYLENKLSIDANNNRAKELYNELKDCKYITCIEYASDNIAKVSAFSISSVVIELKYTGTEHLKVMFILNASVELTANKVWFTNENTTYNIHNVFEGRNYDDTPKCVYFPITLEDYENIQRQGERWQNHLNDLQSFMITYKP